MVNLLTAAQNPSILIPLAGFLAIFLFCLGVLQFRRQLIARKEMLEKIKSGGETIEMQYEGPLPESDASASKNAVLNFFVKLGNRIRPEKPENNSIRRVRFLKAGIRYTRSGAIFWGVKCFLLALFQVGSLLYGYNV